MMDTIYAIDIREFMNNTQFYHLAYYKASAIDLGLLLMTHTKTPAYCVQDVLESNHLHSLHKIMLHNGQLTLGHVMLP